MKLDKKYLNTVCEPLPINKIRMRLYAGNSCPEADEAADLIKEMLKLCYAADGTKIGIGLAANQVGSNKRIIVVNHAALSEGMINPLIEKYRGGIYKSKEGCLSYPRKLVTVKRHKIIKLSWFTELWDRKTCSMRGLLAAVVQHEIDHLDGISMLTRAKLGAATNEGVK